MAKIFASPNHLYSVYECTAIDPKSGRRKDALYIHDDDDGESVVFCQEMPKHMMDFIWAVSWSKKTTDPAILSSVEVKEDQEKITAEQVERAQKERCTKVALTGTIYVGSLTRLPKIGDKRKVESGTIVCVEIAISGYVEVEGFSYIIYDVKYCNAPIAPDNIEICLVDKYSIKKDSLER